jgi:1-deoxyxylulose-5-phosphate synthase
LEYRTLGRSGVKVSRLSLGTNNFGRDADEETTIKIVKKAIDCGINSIDGANVYTGGKSEELIGKALRGDRNRVVLATKVGMPYGKGANMGPNEYGLSRKHIMWQISESLRRLQTDYLDIYYMHRFDPETPLEETLKTFDHLIREGKVLYLACSNFTVENIKSMNAVSDRLGLERIVALEPRYNLLDREAEKELLPYCEQSQLGVITYSPLSGGLLTGKYVSPQAPPPGSRAASASYYWERINKPENFAVAARLRAASERFGIPLSNLAIHWIAKNPAVTSVIVGASRPEQVEENCRLFEARPPDEALTAVESAVRG